MEKWRGSLRKVPSSRYVFTIKIYYTIRHFLVDWKSSCSPAGILKATILTEVGNYAKSECITDWGHFVGSNKSWLQVKTSVYQINFLFPHKMAFEWLLIYIFHFGRRFMTGQGEKTYCLSISQSSEGGKWSGIETPWKHQRF